MFPYGIVKNLTSKVIDEVARFVKRDYLEMRFIKDPKQSKLFFDKSINRTLERMKTRLVAYNKEYGVMCNNEILAPLSDDIYWKIAAVDNYENFANGINYWGIYIVLIKKEDKEKLMSISYFLPFLEEYFYCAEGQGCFLNDKKLNIMNSSKVLIGSGIKKIAERKLGSDLLTVMYCAADRLNVAVLEETAFNEEVANLVMKEAKGKVIKKNKKIIIGNEVALSNIQI